MNRIGRVIEELLSERIALQVTESRAKAARTAALCSQLDVALSLVRDGWVPLHFASEYYGSHDELGEGHAHAFYLFHSSLGEQVAQWESTIFSHGHFGPSDNNVGFYKWLGELSDDLVVCLTE